MKLNHRLNLLSVLTFAAILAAALDYRAFCDDAGRGISPVFVNGTNEVGSIMVSCTFFKIPSANLESFTNDFLKIVKWDGPNSPGFTDFLGQHPDARYLGSPRTVSASGVEAKLQMSKQIPLDGTNLEIGIFLKFLPVLEKDSKIQIKSHIRFQDIVGGTPPVVQKQEADFEFHNLKSGDTVLANTPPFKNTTLLIFVSPKIVKERL